MFFGSSLLLGSFAGKKSNPDILEFAKLLISFGEKRKGGSYEAELPTHRKVLEMIA